MEQDYTFLFWPNDRDIINTIFIKLIPFPDGIYTMFIRRVFITIFKSIP